MLAVWQKFLAGWLGEKADVGFDRVVAVGERSVIWNGIKIIVD